MYRAIALVILAIASSRAWAQIPPGGDFDVRIEVSGFQKGLDFEQEPIVAISQDGMWIHDLGGSGGAPDSAPVTAFIRPKYKVTITWTGTGIPRPNCFARITSMAYSWWSGQTGTAKAVNGLDDLTHTTTYPTWSTQVQSGMSSFPIEWDANGRWTHEFEADATAAAQTEAGMNRRAEVETYVIVDVVEKAVSLYEVGGPTYRRGLFGPVLNERNPLTGKPEGDTIFTEGGYALQWQSDLSWVGQALGPWAKPVEFAWSSSDALSLTVTSEDEWLGSTTSETEDEIGSASSFQPLAQLFAVGANTRRVRCWIGESGGGGFGSSETFLMRVHGPIEDTKERWLPNFSGKLSAYRPTDQAGFHATIVGRTILNDTGQTQRWKVQITQDASYTYGVRSSAGIDSIDLQVLKLHFGNDVTRTISETSGLNWYSDFMDVPHRYELRAEAHAFGTAVFPVCSHWDIHGYTHDSKPVDVRPGHIAIVFTRAYFPEDPS